MKINLPEIGEWMDCAKNRLVWFKRDPKTVWIPAAGRSAGELAEEMMQRFAEHT